MLLERWFTIGMTCVKWYNVWSSWFSLSCGIWQGGVLSPHLFAVYIDSLIRGGSMVSGALGKISRLCPSPEWFMLYMSMSLILNIWLPVFKMINSITFFVMQIRVIFALPSLVPPSLGALGSCPSHLPLDPPLSLIGKVQSCGLGCYIRHMCFNILLCGRHFTLSTICISASVATACLWAGATAAWHGSQCKKVIMHTHWSTIQC